MTLALKRSRTLLRKATPLGCTEQQLILDGGSESNSGHEVGSYSPRTNCREPIYRSAHQARQHTTATTLQQRAELGPKSQRRGSKTSCAILSLLLLFNQFNLAMGANNGPVKPRVIAVAAAATEAPPHHSTAAQAAGAKRCGIGPQGQPRMIRKRALRRAINTAQRTEIAQYRGRIIRAERQSQNTQQNERRHQSTSNRNTHRKGRIEVLTYNAGGLSTHHYAELMVWLSVLRRERRCPDVVMIQETHWQGDTDYSNQDWHVLTTGSSSMHSGVLIMLAKAKFPQAIIRKDVPVPGRVLAARAQQGSTVLSLINVYQKVWNGQQESRVFPERCVHALQRAHKLLVSGALAGLVLDETGLDWAPALI